MDYPCSIKEKDAQPFLAIRVRTSISEMGLMLGQSYGAIMAYLAELGQQPAGASFAAFYNQDMQDMDVEIGMPTAEILDGRDNIYSAVIPAGRVAECIYTGSYLKMQPAYQQLTEFVAAQGEQPSGIAYEFYIDDPAETPPSELRTTILFPLK